ncbi:unnamed protein product, partial [Urochloa humidicola]
PLLLLPTAAASKIHHEQDPQTCRTPPPPNSASASSSGRAPLPSRPFPGGPLAKRWTRMADVAGLVKPRGGAMRDELGSEGDGLASRRRELGRPRLGRSSACRSGLASEFHPPQIERVAGYRHTAPSPSPRPLVPSSRSAPAEGRRRCRFSWH